MVDADALDERITRLGELQHRLAEERAALLELKHSDNFDESTLQYRFGENEQASLRAETEFYRKVLFPLNLTRDDFEDAEYDRHLEEFETFTVEGTHKYTISLENGIRTHVVVDDRDFDLNEHKN